MTDDHAINHHHRVTVHDIAGLLHHLADLRSHGRSDDPAERTAFLAHKAELLARIADQHTASDPAYSDQVRQLATDALTAAKQASSPRQQPGPTQRRTIDRPTNPGGANSQENRGANPG